MKTEEELRAPCATCAARYHVDIAAFCDELCMGWEEIAGSPPTRWSPSAPTPSIT